MHAGLNRFLTFTKLPDNIRAGLFLCRTQGEIYLFPNIDEVTDGMLEDWNGQLMVSDESMLFTKPSIKTEFRYL